MVKLVSWECCGDIDDNAIKSILWASSPLHLPSWQWFDQDGISLWLFNSDHNLFRYYISRKEQLMEFSCPKLRRLGGVWRCPVIGYHQPYLLQNRNPTDVHLWPSVRSLNIHQKCIKFADCSSFPTACQGPNLFLLPGFLMSLVSPGVDSSGGSDNIKIYNLCAYMFHCVCLSVWQCVVCRMARVLHKHWLGQHFRNKVVI